MRKQRVRVEQVLIPMRDGTRLAADVFLVPDGTPRPALLVRTPYGRGINDATKDVARQGWVVVAQSVRGRFASEGRFEPFRWEGVDGLDSVAWCAAQPWCDGRVAMAGGSYLGATQLLAAAQGPPALLAIAPFITSPFVRDDWCYEGGALKQSFVQSWMAGLASVDPRASAARRARAASLGADFPGLFRKPVGRNGLSSLYEPYRRWIEDDPAYWRTVDPPFAARRVRAAGFHAGGWFDCFAEGTLRAYTALRGEGRAPQRLVMGPWSHTTVPREQADAVGGWLFAALDGKDADSGVRVFVMGADEWRDLPDWPPPSTDVRLYLDDDGTLSWTPPEAAGTDCFRYDPADPVPTRGGRVMGPVSPVPGPADQRALEARKDVLVYTSPVLDRPLTVAGMVTASIVFAASADSADVTVKLLDVHPDGRAFVVVDSIRRSPMTPGRSRTLAVDVGSTAYAFLPGHRVRVHVSSSNHPKFDRNPAKSDQRVHRGGRRPSSVSLPVL